MAVIGGIGGLIGELAWRPRPLAWFRRIGIDRFIDTKTGLRL